MRASLSWIPIPELPKGFDQLRAGNIAGQLHRARISSLTKWSRMILGASIVSSK
jgi:hypothetical protein